jgi:predicted amidophosphoribosyltransferase
MMLALPAALIALIVWIVMRRRKKGLTTSVRPCSKCGQEIPSQASFCSLCGKRVI